MSGVLGWTKYLALALVPLIANWPATSGFLNVDPVFTQSGLGVGTIAGVLRGLTALDPNNGITTQALGHYAAQEWLAGRIPWWNPYAGIGLPLAAEGQNQALFLPFVLLLSLRNGMLLLLLALQEVAAFSTYALLRRVGLCRAASWSGGALFALNGTFAWFQHGPMMPVAFLPLLVLGIEMEWWRERDAAQWRVAGWPVAAVAVALSLYAGFPETAFLDGLAASLWAMVRLLQCGRSQRLVFLGRTALGAIAGVLLAAPFIVPFAHMLWVSDLGLHSTGPGALGPAGMGVPPLALPILTIPYLLGSFGSWASGSSPLLWMWTFLGGYISAPVLLLAIGALLVPNGRHLWLRWALFGWIAVMLGVSLRMPGITPLMYALPGLGQTQIYRYAPPSWEFAGVVLAAFAIDDWARGLMTRRTAIVALGLTSAIAVASILAGSGAIRSLLETVPAYPAWLLAFGFWAGFATLGVALLLGSGPPRRRGTVLLMGVLVIDGVVLFSVPRLNGLRHASLETTGLRFVKDHLGLERAYSLGILRPNYGTYWRLASINHDYVPTPRIWSEYIASALDRGSDGNSFSGAYFVPGLEQPDHFTAFRENVAAFERLGVRYVLVPVGQTLHPFMPARVGPIGPAVALDAGRSLQAVVPDTLPGGSLETISIVIGTYAGAARGDLVVKACSQGVCATGRANVAGASDNKPIALDLDQPLVISAKAELAVKLNYDGPGSLAIWTMAGTPLLSFGYTVPEFSNRRVFSDRVMTVYELGQPSPYFTTEGAACGVEAISREVVRTDCSGAARLIRRELFFAGWRATVDGLPADINRAEPIMQQVDLPRGKATVRFSYAPPFSTASGAAFLIGFVLVLVGFGQDWKREPKLSHG